MNIKNSQPDFVFIIPTLSNKSGLENLIQNINNFYSDVPVIVVNNSPNKELETQLHVQDIKNRLVFINQAVNTGFAKACNDGANYAEELFRPEYFVFLNDDTLFTQDWLEKCLSTMKKNKWVATTPLLIDLKGRIENVGYIVLPYGRVRLIKNAQSKEKIDGISATALVFQAEKFLQLGGFDKRFFAYLEDVDLFLRAKKQGFSFGVTKSASVYHEGQKTSVKMKSKKAWLDFRNWILLIAKNWSRGDLIKYFPQILVERVRNFSGVIKALF